MYGAMNAGHLMELQERGWSGKSRPGRLPGPWAGGLEPGLGS